MCPFQVSLAAQTLSSSVAKALDFVRDIGIHGYEDVDATILFLQTIDRLFDILNSRTPTASGYKRPINLSNYDHVKEFLSFAEELILGLEADDRPLVSSVRYTGFVGFLFCIRSFLNLSKELLTQAQPLKYVLSYKFSQDHIELLFNSIRGALGWNTNPTPKQFGFIIRRLHARVGITPDSNGNCINFSDDGCNDDSKPSDVCEDQDDFLLPTSAYLVNVIAYIGGFVVRKLLRHDNCPECRASLVASAYDSTMLTDELYFIRLRNNGGLLIPSPDVIKVLKIAESVFCSLPLRKQIPSVVTVRVLNALPFKVFSSDHMIENDHRSRTIRSLIHVYCNLRSHHLAKMKYLSNTRYKRHILTKQIHFLSQ